MSYLQSPSDPTLGFFSSDTDVMVGGLAGETCRQ